MNKNKTIVPVILAGGSGTRLWPLSRKNYPKHLLSFVNNYTLLQTTISRIQSYGPFEHCLVVTNQNYRFEVAEQLREIDQLNQTQILLEPFGRNSAPAIGVAAHYLLRQYDDPVMFVVPSDHYVTEDELFPAILSEARSQAEKGLLVLFGIQPDYPAKGYGYIQCGTMINHRVYEVIEFKEKPTLDQAQQYLKQGNYFWNSGMFAFQASVFCENLAHTSPKINTVTKYCGQHLNEDLHFLQIPPKHFEQCPSESVDYAVMEKSSNRVLLPLSLVWKDLGEWSSVAEMHRPDSEGNVTIGDVVAQNTHNSYIHSTHRLVTTVGLDSHVVVESRDAVLVASKDNTQATKQLVQTLSERQRQEVVHHSKVYRPWGYYETLVEADGYKVKMIMVKPHASLSLQKHYYRCEHWVVVGGIADIIKGDEQLQLDTNQSLYVPQDTLHQLSNTQDRPLWIIEIQTGTYLGEDDIVRYEDMYGRAEAISQG